MRREPWGTLVFAATTLIGGLAWLAWRIGVGAMLEPKFGGPLDNLWMGGIVHGMFTVAATQGYAVATWMRAHRSALPPPRAHLATAAMLGILLDVLWLSRALTPIITWPLSADPGLCRVAAMVAGITAGITAMAHSIARRWDR